MFSKFLLGDLNVADSAKRVLGRTPLDLLARHAVCEFGVISPRQYKTNLHNLEEVGEIVSLYPVDPVTNDLGHIRITTHEGWGSTDVVWVKPPPKTKRRKDVIPF